MGVWLKSARVGTGEGGRSRGLPRVYRLCGGTDRRRSAMQRLWPPTPATVIACLALFVALGGGAYAAAKISRDDLSSSLSNAIPIRVTDALPDGGFRATNASVKNTKDGVKFGPYANGGTDGGSICTNNLDGQPLDDVKHLAYVARYTADNETNGVGVPYLRIF